MRLDEKKAIIGIDPGFNGAVCIMWRDLTNKIELFDVPFVEVIKSGKTKKGNQKKGKEYLDNSMAEILEDFYGGGRPTCHVFLEKVGAMPKQGVASMFSFGTGYGLWKGIIAAYHLPCTLVTPQSWKKELMQGMKDKEASLVVAQQLFPQCRKDLVQQKDIGKADALLLCEFGRRRVEGI